jgi:hypothetical protein
VPRPLFIPCEQHGQPDELRQATSKRPSGLFIPGRGLRGRHREHPHGQAPPHEMVAQWSPPRGCCPRRRSRRSVNRSLPKSSRMTPKFCPLPYAGLKPPYSSWAYPPKKISGNVNVRGKHSRHQRVHVQTQIRCRLRTVNLACSQQSPL